MGLEKEIRERKRTENVEKNEKNKTNKKKKNYLPKDEIEFDLFDGESEE